MHEALLLVARAIALAHDRWRSTVGRRGPLSGQIAVLEERVRQLEAEGALLRARFLRVPGLRRPHYRHHERLEILWHAARYQLSITATADVFCLTRQTILNWRAVMRRKSATLLPPIHGLPDLVRELVHRLRAEWPAWGTRRIAGQLARLGVKASRSSVQRILRRPRVPTPDDRLLPGAVAGLLAKHPNHIWMIDFTRLKGIVRPVFVGAVIDAYSRKVLDLGFIRGEPNSRFAARLLRSAISKCGSPTWLVSDKDRAFQNKLVNGLLRRHGIRRRYGAVRKKGSTGIIERFWRSMKNEYARHWQSRPGSIAIEAGSMSTALTKGSGNVRLTTCSSIDQRNRRATSPAACCRSGSSREIVGCPYYACAAQRSSHPLTLSAEAEVCVHVGVEVSVQRHPREQRPESAGQR